MPGDATTSVDVAFATGGRGIPDEDEIQAAVRAAIDGAASNRAVELSVRVTGREEIRALNRDFRGRDEETNVLSFPAGPPPGLPRAARRFLGDIVICAPVLEDEARSQGKPLGDHWAHMLTHGTLHLLGYDHEEDSDAERMEALETRILAARGIDDPYSAR